MSGRLLPLAAALTTVGFWGSAFVGIRSAGHAFSPGALALGRLTVGSVVLTLIALARREPLPPRRALPGIVITGVLWLAVYSVALNSAERRIDAGTASMLVNVAPILIAVLAGLVLHEGFPRTLLVGCVVAFGGVGLIALADSRRGITIVGTLLCLLAAAVYSISVIAQKLALARASALQTTWLGCCIGALTCTPFAPALAHDVARAPGSSIGWIVYLGVFSTALAFTTWAFALARTDAGRLGSMTYLAPPISILLGWAILGETPAGLAFVGGALCLVGVVIARSGSSPRARTALRAAASRRPRPSRTDR